MDLGNAGWRGLLASVGIIGGSAGITLGAATLLGVNVGSEEVAPSQVAAYQPSAQPPGPRDRLAICVDAIAFNEQGEPLDGDPGTEIAAKSALEASLTKVAEHPSWPLLSFPNPPVVDIGCPSEPLPLTTSGVKWQYGQPDSRRSIQGVFQESYYSIFAFALPSLADIDRLIGGTEERVGTQEFVCNSDDPHGLPCKEDTLAIYIVPGEIQDVSFLSLLISRAAGLTR